MRKTPIKRMTALLLLLGLLLGTISPGLTFAQAPSQLEPSEEIPVTDIIETPPESEPDETPATDEAGQALPRLADWPLAPETAIRPQAERLDEAVFKALDETGYADVIIRLAEQPDLISLQQSAGLISSRSERAQMVVDHLQQVAAASQAEFEPVLQDLIAQEAVSQLRSYWIFNGYAARVTPVGLEALLEHEQVARISLDAILEMPELTLADSPPDLPTWGLENSRATEVWAEYGLYGQGVVVGIMDTGVTLEHESLRHNYRGRDGNHAYSWIDVSGNQHATPYDGHGHGTHVAGTAVGGNDGRPTGVAPKAEWIAAKIFSDAGQASTSGIHEAFQWMIAPGGDPAQAPHVVNNSWGSSAVYNMEYWEDVQAWVAAGIFPLFAAGNDGPGSTTVNAPGSFPHAFAIGAHDIDDQLAFFSSRGPIYWPDESGASVHVPKPQISAPGVAVLSAYPAHRGRGDYVYASGTSMATPHVAGAIALIWQARPDLTMDEVMNLLENTARHEPHMGQVPNDQYGRGALDIYRAVTEAAYAGQVRGQLSDTAGQPIPGEIFIADQNMTISVPESGQFEFTIRAGNYTALVRSFGYYDQTENLIVEQGETSQVDWRMTRAAQYQLSGSVTTGDGSPVQHAFIRLHDTPVAPGRTDSEGRYEFNGLPEDTYQVTVSGAGIRAQTQSVVLDGDKTLDFTVETLHAQAAPGWATANNNNQRNALSQEVIAHEKLTHDWTIDLPAQAVFTSPAAAEGVIVLTNDRGLILAYDELTGEKLWEVTTGATNRSSPTIANGKVYVGGGVARSVYAIDLRTGLTDWIFKPANTGVYESPLYHEGVLYLSAAWTENGHLSAVDAQTGTLLWDTVVGDGLVFGASLGDDRLYVGTFEGRSLKALSKDDGSLIWSFDHPKHGFAARPVYADGVVYAASTDFSEGALWALDAATGEVLWSVEDIGDSQAVSPIVYDNLVIQGSAAKATLRAFDKTSGQEIWRTNRVTTMVNNGAVSANGVLYVVDNVNMLKAVDVFTGEILQLHNLPGQSSSGVAINSGRVIVATSRALSSFASYAKLSGYITDQAGQALPGKVELLDSGLSAQADDEGYYELAVPPGSYQVRASFYGYIQKEIALDFSSGLELKQDFTLLPGDTGTLSGRVIDNRTKQPIGQVEVSLRDTGLETMTDADGQFNFNQVVEGEYQLVASATGYVTFEETIVIQPGQASQLDIRLLPVDVAVLNDYQGAITKFLNHHDIPAEEADWDIVSQIDKYRIVYLNGGYGSYSSKPTAEQVHQLVDAARQAGVSLVFADQWGISWGSIRHLHEFYGDPASIDSVYSRAHVTLDVDVAHPIFGQAEVGQRLQLYTGEAEWFNQYSGRHLGTLATSRDGPRGSGVAYKAVSEDSAHLLLSTHSATPWVSTVDWLAPQQQILVNGIRFLLSAEFGKVSGRVTSGQTAVAASLEIEETGVRVDTLADGSFELYHDPGDYHLVVRSTGYASQTIPVTIAVGKPIELEIELEVSDSGVLSGQVMNRVTQQPIPQALVKLYDQAGELVAETIGNSSGWYEFSGLDEADYTVEVKIDGYVYETVDVTVDRQTPPLNFALWPAPEVGIVGDYSSSGRNITAVLQEVGITATSLKVAPMIERMSEFDVVIYHYDSPVTKNAFDNLLAAADEHQVSLIFGDDYNSTNTGLEYLVRYRGDPAIRQRHDNRTNEVYYRVLEKNMLFGQAETGDMIDIILPAGARIASFDDYSGYPLARIGHRNDPDEHGLGVAYMPRTGSSLEMIMSGHGISIWRYLDHYTAQGRRMFVDAVLWAGYTQFPVIEGTVRNQAGEPLLAEITIIERNKTTRSNPETGHFSYAELAGSYTLEIASFGYQSQTIEIDLNMDSTPLDIVLEGDPSAGSLSGQILDEYDNTGVAAELSVSGYPRQTTADASGNYTLDGLMPGQYELVVTAEGYLQQEIPFTIQAGQVTRLDVALKPSPTVGIIVDTTYDRQDTLSLYLTGRGWKTIELEYHNLELLDQVDLIYANSDFNNSKIPSQPVFEAFLKALDEKRIPVIWTGEQGGRGSIRYLWEYTNNPAEEIRGSRSGTNIGRILDADHPIVAGIPDNYEWNAGGYYYAFNDYSGHSLVEYSHSELGDLGVGIAYRGRTIDSLEILLSQFTFGYQFATKRYFDEYRERILNNALLWAIENDQPLVGEMTGRVVSHLGPGLSATIHVIETGQVITSDSEGDFFLALDDGTYQLEIEAFGHTSKTFTVEFARGQVQQREFELMAHQSGRISGQVTSAETGLAVADASLEMINTPLATTSDADGQYTFLLPVGQYTLRISAPGFAPQVIGPITIAEGDDLVQNIALSNPETIAVIGSSTNRNRVSAFLSEIGYQSEGFNYDSAGYEALMARLSEFSLIWFNDIASSFTDDMMRSLLTAAEQHDVSLIFASQWGTSPINRLSTALGDPARMNHSSTPTRIHYRVVTEHPILAGFEVGDEIALFDNGRYDQQYNVFFDYSGELIAEQTKADGELLGGGLAYRYPTANSVHLLMGSMSFSTYTPQTRWTEHTRQIYINAIDWVMTTSLGEIIGTVTDQSGQPIERASVSLVGGATSLTDEAGRYRLGVGLGVYTVQVTARGYLPAQAEVTVSQLGVPVTQDFILEATERAAVFGQVRDLSSDSPLADVAVSLTETTHGTSYEAVTDSSGNYRFDNLLAGDYELSVQATGYRGLTRRFSLAQGDAREENFNLSRFDTAILGDFKHELADFLLENEIAAESRDWDLLDDIANYRLVIVNTPDGTPEQVNRLIEQSDEHQVSLVFVDSWGIDTGSIELLHKALGYPESDNQGYNQGAVYLEPTDHPIFEGFEPGEMIRVHSPQAYYATFKNYPGFVIANLHVDQTDKGHAIGYDFRSDNHVHLLLSSFAVNNKMGPTRGWTADGRQLFIQALAWAKTARQDLPAAPVWDENPIISFSSQVEVSGTADYRSQVVLSLDGEWLATIEPGVDNRFSHRLDLTPGQIYQVQVVARNYAGETAGQDLSITVVDVPLITEPDDGLQTHQASIVVRGQVIHDGQVRLYNNGQPVATVTTQDNAFEAAIALHDGPNAIAARYLLGDEETELSPAVTVYREASPPEISQILPAEDVVLHPGDRLVIALRSSRSGGQASYQIVLPGIASDSLSGSELPEVSPGLYQAEWIAPEDMVFSRASIVIEHRDAYGHHLSLEAPGKVSLQPLPIGQIELTDIQPKEDIELLPGETTIISFNAPSGGSGSYYLTLGRSSDQLAPLALDMIEGPAGVYQATYTASEDNLFSRAQVVVQYLSPEGETASAVADGTISVIRPPVEPPEDIELSDFKPEQDVILLAGETVEIALRGPSGGTAGYRLILPVTTQQTEYLIEMIEDSPGWYRANYQAPQDMVFSLAEVEFHFTADDGRTAQAKAPGRISVRAQDPPPTKPVIERLFGSNRFATAVAISQRLFDSADRVILANGHDFPDALVGGLYAYQADAPLLLSSADQVPSEVMTEIKRLGASRVVLLGGRQALGETIAEQLRAAGLTVERIAGANRYQTAVEISQRARAPESKHVYLVSSYNFPDALSLVPVAAKDGHAILLSGRDQLDPATAKALADWQTERVTIMGGSAIIGPAIVQQLQAQGYQVDRIAGVNRYDTNIKLIQQHYPQADSLVGVSGHDFPDALVATVFAAKHNQPIGLLNPEGLDQATRDYLAASAIRHVTLMGGLQAIPAPVEQEIYRLLDR